ncbi:MAG: hypothetical protein GXY65_00925 [Rhodococcus sp.]|uniref:MSCRAMM family protein n=1 Tax=Rhodococcus sp. TaxID=1831 RepID=UPI00169BD838|nr:prealbumin-like fold domain-containing protein [Rhodococcus sp. (in: high G+C Gram-positive bacteria)]NLV77908.1 hypothetical protein [Rhodococcus sp. (in: high G+C Gram-positive bacteria)]
MRIRTRILTILAGSVLAVATTGPAVADPVPVGDGSSTTAATTTAPTTTMPTPTTTTTAPPDAGIETGTVTIRAATLSEDDPLPGVTSSVARCETGQVVDSPVTGADGTANVEAPLGCYNIALVDHPWGFEPVSAGPWQVEITAPGQVVAVGFVLQRTSPDEEGTLTVHAWNVTDDTPVPGVTAALNSCVDDGPYGYMTTELDGSATTRLPLQCYVVSLVSTPPELETVAGGPFTVELTDPDAIVTAEFRFAATDPYPPTAYGRLVKMDRLDGTLLGGAIFDIGPCNAEWTHRVVTEADGQVGLALVPGCYVAKEVHAPDGYVVDPRPTTFTATDDAYFTVQVFDLPVDPGPIFRNPDARVPVRSIPAGPVER